MFKVPLKLCEVRDLTEEGFCQVTTELVGEGGREGERETERLRERVRCTHTSTEHELCVHMHVQYTLLAHTHVPCTVHACTHVHVNCNMHMCTCTCTYLHGMSFPQLFTWDINYRPNTTLLHVLVHVGGQ